MRPTGSWQDVLETQFYLFRFWRSEMGERYGREMLRSMKEKQGLPAKVLVGDRELHNVEASKMLFADPIYVSEEMFTVAEEAAKTFQAEPLVESDLLTNTGFILFPRPFITRDWRGKKTTWRAVSWMPLTTEEGRAGIHVTAYSSVEDLDLDDYGDLVTEEMRAKLAWAPLFVVPWYFDEAAPEDQEGVDWWVQLQVMLRLTMQHIAERSEEQAPRATRRRWQRERPDFKDRYVVVVKLRRPRHSNESAETEVEWTQRWIVGGHWRRQWYASLQAHRQIWISPYVKGPEGKPLVIRARRAFELVR